MNEYTPCSTQDSQVSQIPAVPCNFCERDVKRACAGAYFRYMTMWSLKITIILQCKDVVIVNILGGWCRKWEAFRILNLIILIINCLLNLF